MNQNLSSIVSITKKVAINTFQIVIGYICVDLMSTVNLHFLEEFGDKYQTAAYGMSFLIISLFIVPLGFGFNQTLNNHVSQCFGQNKNKLCQTYLNFTLYTQLFYIIPFCIVIYNCQFLLRLIIKEQDQLDVVMNYSKQMMIPLMIAQFIQIEAECLKNYLIACNIFKPFAYIHSSTLLFHILFCITLSKFNDFGYYTLCIAIVLSEVVALILLIIYIYVNEDVSILFRDFQIKPQIFQYWRNYCMFLKECIPLAIHIYADFIIFYILTVISFSLGINQTNGQLAFANISGTYFKIPMSLSITIMSMVGNSLSQSNILLAQQQTKSAIYFYLLIFIIVVSFIYYFRNAIALLYTHDIDIQNLILQTLPYFIIGNIFFDGLQGTLTGVLKAINKSTFVSKITIFSYYIIGIPLILILTFKFNLQLIGIWFGFGISNFVLCIIFLYELYKINWEEQVKIIQERLEQHQEKLDDIDFQEVNK